MMAHDQRTLEGVRQELVQALQSKHEVTVKLDAASAQIVTLQCQHDKDIQELQGSALRLSYAATT